MHALGKSVVNRKAETVQRQVHLVPSEDSVWTKPGNTDRDTVRKGRSSSPFSKKEWITYERSRHNWDRIVSSCLLE